MEISAFPKASSLWILSLLFQISSAFAQGLTPQNFTAQQTGSGQVTLTWAAGMGAFECSEYNITDINLAVGVDSETQVDCSKTSYTFNDLPTGLWTFSIATRYTEEVCSVNSDTGDLECENNEETSPSSPVIAVNVSDSLGFNEGDYTVHYGDINGDNIDDIYLKARQQFIPIHGHILIPILIPTGDSYVLLSSPSGYQSLEVNNDIDVNSLSVVSSVAYTDFNGDGLLDITVGQAGSTRFDITILASSGDSAPVYYADAGPMVIDRTTHTSTPSVNHDASVGATAGKFEVDASGGASYTVPIQLPAGTAGLTPKLSLTYSSGAGNGVVGKGWNIGGMSSIARCGQRNLYDNKAMAIQWNADDRFCMNGTRLILKSGSYGAPGSTYTTEIENHVVVTALGGTLGSPDYFESVSRSGHKTRYGFIEGGNEAKHITAGGTYRWARSHEYDLADNKITYHYSTTNNTFLLKEVRYAYGASDSYGYRVVYQYDRSREDTQAKYIGGYRVNMLDRLHTISVQKAGGVGLRSYSLVYKALNTSQAYYNRLSRLESIEECAGQGSHRECLSPTVFTWSQDSSRGTITNPGTLFLSGDAWIHEWSSPDVNADGYQDLLIKYDTSRNSSGTANTGCSRLEQLYLGSASGLEVATTKSEGSCGSFTLPRSLNRYLERYRDINEDGRVDRGEQLSTYDGTSWNLGAENPEHGTGSSIYIDINGDALPDLIRPTYSTRIHSATDLAELEISLAEIDSQASSASNQVIRYQAPYKVTLPPIRRGLSESSGLSSAFDLGVSHRAIGDFNGDGKPDLVYPLRRGRNNDGKYEDFAPNEEEGALTAYAIFDLPLQAGSASIIDTFLGPAQKSASILAGDINADGSDDLIAKFIKYDGDDMDIHYRITGHGDGSFIPVFDMNNGSFSLADHDNDGFLDVIGPDILLWRGVEHGFIKGPRLYATYVSSGDRVITGDFNGDGLTDYMKLEATGTIGTGVPSIGHYNRISVNYSQKREGFSNRITIITTGLGHTTEITYENIGNSDHYVPFDINVNSPTEIRDSICLAGLNGSCQNR